MTNYFADIRDGIKTTLKGLGLTARHLRNATHRRGPTGVADDGYFDLQDGLVTVQYPHEQLPIPDNGRYRLHNEIDDCIVCDKCAKVCPVDCITIDPIKATEEVGRASDGSPIRLYAATFDIDMAKCCYCGLCTVVCPTECLTMEKKFDYSTFSLDELNYQFANLTPAQADEKRALYEQFVQEKEAAKLAKQQAATPPPANVPDADVPTETAAKPKPAFRPGMKSPAKPAPAPADNVPAAGVPAPQSDVPSATAANDASAPTESAAPPKPRPAFRPGMKPAAPKTDVPTKEASDVSSEGHRQHPLTDPAPDEAETIAMVGVAEQPHVTEPLTQAEQAAPTEAVTPAEFVAKKAPFRPTMKPPTAPAPPPAPPPADSDNVPAEPVKPPKPAGFKPTMKPAPKPTTPPPDELLGTSEPSTDAPGTFLDETPPAAKSNAFRPTMKPKSSE